MLGLRLDAVLAQVEPGGERMRERVLKYTLQLRDEVLVPAHPRAVPIGCAMQHGEPVVWMRVPVEPNDDPPKVGHVFQVAGTGHHRADLGKYVGRLDLDERALIFHVFWTER